MKFYQYFLLLLKNLLLIVFISCSFFISCFSLEENDSIGDIIRTNGFTYREIKIGNQIWMDKDFRKTSGIPRIQDGHEWSSTKDPAYCINPDNNALLYNWFAVTSDNFAPDGWVVPNNNDWSILGDALKESAENRSKFGIKATGGRNPISSGDSQFYDSFESADWWTSSSDFSDLSDFEREQHGVFYGFNLNNNSISRYCFTNNDGHAVRLIKK